MTKIWKIIRKFLDRIKWKEIPPATYVRYILMLISVINVVFTRLGWNPISISETELYQTVSDVLGVLILIANTWFNNSVTEEALDADMYKKDLVERNKAVE